MTIPARELAAIQRDIGTLLPDTCVRRTLTAASDGGGGRTETWADAGTSPCRITYLAGGERDRQVGARVDERSTHLVTLPAGFTVTEADRLVIDGQAYEVTLVRKRGAMELARLVEVREVQ